MKLTMLGLSVLVLTTLLPIQGMANEPAITRATAESLNIKMTVNAPIEIELKGQIDLKDTLNPKRKKYYTLGGIRIQFKFDTAQIVDATTRADIKTFSWVMGAAGRYCTDYTAKDATCTNNDGTVPIEGNEKHTLFWEPDAATGVKTDWDISLRATPKLTISFNNSETQAKILSFKLENRLLEAIAAPKTIKGSDVEILESILWHLGMSPSDAPGSQAVRLKGSNKKLFNTGTPSVGLMMGRFNYINYGFNVVEGKKIIAKGIKDKTQEMHTGEYKSPGDKKTYSVLSRLEQHWRHYKMAYDNVSTTPFKIDNLSADDFKNAVAIFDGGTMSYSNKYDETGTVMEFSATYTADEHKKVSDYKAFTRADILKAMASREASNLHWGNKGAHRVHVGGADELGSKGFNQIQNMYSYGSRSSQGDHRDGARCYWVSAYSQTGKSIVNHYDPSQNLLAKAAFLAGGAIEGDNRGGDCGRSFFKGFKQKLFTAKHDSPNSKLIKTTTGSKIFVVKGVYSDDTYEVLIKALGAYNQGSGTFNTDKSWSELLITPASSLKPAVVTAMEYGYDILHGKSRGIELPDRVYIWEGEAPKDKNGDGETKNIEADPTATPPVLESNEEGWCFAYGEEEWMAGKVFDDVAYAASDKDDKGRPKLSIGKINCTTGATL